MNYFPSLLLFSFSLLSQFENGCKCIIFASGAICNHTRHPDTTPRPGTPTRGTPRPDTDTRNGGGCNPERTPEAHTRGSRTADPHTTRTQYAARPPTQKAVRTTANTTRSDRRRHTRGRTEAPRQDTRQLSPHPYNRQDNRPP